VALIQVIFSLWQARVEAASRNTHQRRSEPLALIAGILASGTAVFVVWLSHHGRFFWWILPRESYQASLPLVIPVAASGLLSVYGSFSQLPHRRIALGVAGVMLMIIGVEGILSIPSLGLPILVSGILASAAILRLILQSHTTPQHSSPNR
jgi:hypothetical protein